MPPRTAVSSSFLSCFLALCTCGYFCAASAPAGGADGPGPDAAVTATADALTPVPGATRPLPEPGLAEDLSALPPSREIRRVTVLAGTSGSPRPTDAQTAVGTGAPSKLVYSNTLGKFVWGPVEANRRLADDITTTAVSGCSLDRYVILVTGDKDGDGSGVGPFSVDVAFYPTCPGALRDVDPVPIAGTAAQIELLDNGTYLVTVVIPEGVDVPIPSSFYLGLSFSREKAGVGVGGLPTVGFSDDRMDIPLAPCNGWLGGFPRFPHASISTQVYVRQDCADSFVGYRNSSQVEGPYSCGLGCRFADDIQLSVPRGECNLVAYEVAFRGAIVGFDLREVLNDSDPAGDTSAIPGTTGACFPQTPNQNEICRVEVDPPVRLDAANLWITYRSGGSTLGPLRTCRDAQIGETANFHRVYNQADRRWEDVPGEPLGWGCWGGFDATIYCQGRAPEGACCDMVQTDDNGDSICREVAEGNCAPSVVNYSGLWEEGGRCGPACDGGENNGQPCATEQDCPDGTCLGSFCAGGANEGLPCSRQADCLPGGACVGGAFAHACGLSACCTAADTCENVTKQECAELAPEGPSELFQVGRFCGEYDQWCPFYYCTQREGDCMQSSEAPGCENPFCCHPVCEVDPYCCQEQWDGLCVRLAAEVCEHERPNNDFCFDSAHPWNQANSIEVDSQVTIANIGTSAEGSFGAFACHSEGACSPAEGSVWFKFVATHDSARVSTCGSDPPPGDSLIQVYRVGDSSTPETACGSLEPIGCSDDSPECGNGQLSDVCVTGLVPGDLYYIELASKTPEDQGVYVIDVSAPCSPARPRMVNDWCEDAIELTGGDAEPLVIPFDLSGHVAVMCPNGSMCDPGDSGGVPDRCADGSICRGQEAATLDCPGPPDQCTTLMQNDVWYKWTATVDGSVEMDTCEHVCLEGENLGARCTQDDDCGPEGRCGNPETALAVYEGCECPAEDSRILTCSGFESEPCDHGSRVMFPVREGQCYLLRLGGHLGSLPHGNLTIREHFCDAGAVIFTDPPEGIIDARQPHPPLLPFATQGISSFTSEAPQGAEIDLDGSTARAIPLCWSFCETRNTGSANRFRSMVRNADDTVTVQLFRGLTPDAVSTLSYMDYLGAATTGVFFVHTGNVNGDGMADEADVEAVIACCLADDCDPAAMPPDEMRYRCDIDQSGMIAPADLLREIDLLQGAEGYAPGRMGTSKPSIAGCVSR